MTMKKATFQLPKEQAKLISSALMGGQDGIYFTFMSDMGTIASLVPPPLEPAMPLVSGYIVNINEPAFAKPYREAMLGVYVRYKGTVGMYPVSFLLSGPGAEMATYLGREKTGLPKKLCDSLEDIRIERDGDRIRGIVERHGTRLMDVSMKLGEYNNPMVGDIYSNPEPGKKTGGTSFYFLTGMEPNEQGQSVFNRVSLISNVAEYTYRTWTPGKVSIRLQSSQDDAWGELPVLQNMGGAYAENDLEMKEMYIVERLDVETALPYLLTTRFDTGTRIGG